MKCWKGRWNGLENHKKILNLLGLATKAGKTASGGFMTEKSVKGGKAFLVLVPEDASDNTKKMFFNMCTIKSRFTYLEERKSWATPLAGRRERQWQCWTQVFPKRSQSRLN